jgi:signal peptidase I
MITELLNCYGKTKFYQHVLGITLGYFYLPYIGFRKRVTYSYTHGASEKNKKSDIHEWFTPIYWMIFLTVMIKWLLADTFIIPTPSMENTLLMGDVIIVSKIHYGARTPVTPLQIPLTHQTIPWIDNNKSYSDWIKLPAFRLPGLTKIKRNDVVVFNWPADKIHKPQDLKTYYIKRCIALPGDTVSIANSIIHINAHPAEDVSSIQFEYKVYTNRPISKTNFQKYGIPNYYQYEKKLCYLDESKSGYFIQMTPAIAKSLITDGIVDSIEINTDNNNWRMDNYGSLWIPEEGVTIPMNKENVSVYGKTILDYEEVENAMIKNKTLYINDKKINEYTFKNDYYFMLGDNRHHSYDSRFWGLVPDAYIAGKAWFVSYSIDPDPKKKLVDAIRYTKFFSRIE